MTRPDPRQNAAESSAMAGAVDLSALKNKTTESSRGASTQRGSAQGGSAQANAGGSWVVDVTESTFQSEVVERSMQVPVVVDLWADWCEPCKQLSPALERLAAEGGGSWVLAKIDVEANQRITQLFGVQSIPTVIAVAGGQPVEAFAGAQPEAQIREWINSVLDAQRDQLPGIRAAEESAGASEEEDPRFTAAEDALERGDYAEATSAYQRILDAEPDNEQAKAALTQVRFTERAENADPTAIERAETAPDDPAAQIAAADAEVAAQQVQAAFDRLIGTVKRTSGEDRDSVRRHLIEMFELFPEGDERVATARRSLASALF